MDHDRKEQIAWRFLIGFLILAAIGHTGSAIIKLFMIH